LRTLCIIPCGKRKVWDKNPNAGPNKARYVYIGSFATKCREYAEKFYPLSWCILSAKYGFLFPDNIVHGPYNASFKHKRTNPVSIEELIHQVIQKRLDAFDRIVVLGGRNYVNVIKEVFKKKNIHTPLDDCQGIGYMMRKLNDSIERGIPL